MGGRNRGGQKRGRTQRRHFRDGRQDVWKKPRPDGEEQPPSEGGWDPFVTESPAFELYYKSQHIVPEEEWDSFLATLRRPLPAVFRVNSSGQFAMEIRTQIQEEFAGALNLEVDGGEREEVVKPLPWYPGKSAWHLNFSRMQLRKNQTLAKLHEFLKRENEIGNITRQEAVSMVPPLFLDVQPNHRVLDMCAAPGSKTFQLLEMIHRDDKKGSLSTGLVVANDVDVQRCHLLVHQTKRMCSPNVIVTNHKAQHFPGLKKDKEITRESCDAAANDSTLSADAKNTEPNEERGLIFDCILCDVPCSGDGTIRKAPDIWKKWNLGNANGLHRLQIQIAMRGVALLRVGGRLVYSTCSLNPIENEAVVGEILRRSGGCLELLDVSNELPDLKRRPGLKTWKVRDKGLWISSYQNVNKHRAGSIVPSMFPNGSPEDQINTGDEELLTTDTPTEETPHESLEMSEENVLPNVEKGEDEVCEIATLPLERCLRILPHDQDTGGFFVAVFRKSGPFKAEQPLRRPDRSQTSARKEELHNTVHADGNELGTNQACTEAEAVVQQSSETANETFIRVECNDKKDVDEGLEAQSKAKPSRPQQQGNWKGVDPVLFLTDEALIESIISFYGIKDTLPLRGHLVTRSEDTSRLKRIYYISESVANVLRLNFRTGEQMKMTSLGLKIFERQGGKESFSPCAFRIASEGLPLLLPHLTRQLIHASRQDFKQLLSVKTTPFSAFSGSGFVASLQTLAPGCCVVILDDGGQDDAQSQNSSVTAIGCWRGRSNLSLLIPKEEAAQLLDRLFDDGKNLELLKTDTEMPASMDDVADGDAQDGTNVEPPLLASFDGGHQIDADASWPVVQAALCEDLSYKV